MPSWTVPGTPIREQLRAHAKEATPKALFSGERSEEIEETLAELHAMARRYGDDWVRMTYVLKADRPWLLAHAHDRGVPAIDGESNEDFRARIANPPELVTLPAILSAIQAIVDTAGVVGDVVAYPLRPNKAFLGYYSSELRLEDLEFTKLDATTMMVERLAGEPFATRIIAGQDRVTIADTADNDGTFVVSGWRGNGLLYTNAAGVTASESAVGFSLVKYDQDGNVWDGHPRAYLSRGYRMGSRAHPNTGIVIMPYGTTEVMRQSAQALASQAAAFGVPIIVERRINP